MAEQNMCRMTQLRLRYGISQASQSKGHEALIRRAFSAVIASRRAALDGLAHELDAAPWLFSMSKEDDEHGF